MRPSLSIDQIAKKAKGKCVERYCRNTRVEHRNYCGTCTHRKWRRAYPERALFYNLKSAAKRRGIDFGITRPEFIRLAHAFGYVEGHGRELGKLQVDRIERNRGYFADNIQFIKVELHTLKSYVEKWTPFKAQSNNGHGAIEGSD